MITALLPVAVFAPVLTRWHKGVHHTVSAFAHTFAAKRDDLHREIVDVTSKHGSACKEAIASVVSKLFGEYGGMAHEAFLAALIIHHLR